MVYEQPSMILVLPGGRRRDDLCHEVDRGVRPHATKDACYARIFVGRVHLDFGHLLTPYVIDRLFTDKYLQCNKAF